MKTKTQLLAERNVLKQLLSTAVGAAADQDLAEDAVPFAKGVCRHFAMLFAAGCSAPKTATWQQPIGQGRAPGNSPAGSPGAGTPGELVCLLACALLFYLYLDLSNLLPDQFCTGLPQKVDLSSLLPDSTLPQDLHIIFSRGVGNLNGLVCCAGSGGGSGPDSGGRPRPSSRQQSFKELDPHLFLDAIVEVHPLNCVLEWLPGQYHTETDML